ncbi:MAG: DUF5615 family PIN-like protein [Gemmatimonadota bacterium]
MRFLFDVHFHRGACDQLKDRGVEAVHASGIGLGRASDAEVLDRAISEERIVVTRNYRHFAPLVDACVRRGKDFPGVLFLAPSIPQGDAGAHVEVIERWIRGIPPGENPIANTFGWLR